MSQVWRGHTYSLGGSVFGDSNAGAKDPTPTGWSRYVEEGKAVAAVLQEHEGGRVGRSVKGYFPIFGWLPSYRRNWFIVDAVAAISVWALLVPQSLGYATLAGVPVQYGLYTAFAALVAYAIFGTSKQVVQGPSGSVAAVSAAVVAPLVGMAAMGTEDAVSMTAALAITTGVVYLALGIAKAGWISNFLSRA